ncbi:hypothetical protein TRFO_39428 [Tritrichomonas foetus]|uniref:Peptidase M14 domain-containing protein n=1 Tax=Tritrichomonas foetus TaxID=1144522 RepID=A0A1J4JAB9_9EUKA|nr:hypothetical protein TRFO_39428 [Tritrichomonas foetus]|eukprot:OHS94397.1 hypothetical protein TRFO_39428 [Tritrichomonas foetus]
MLSDSSSDDEIQAEFIPKESIKDKLTIIHHGNPPPEPQPFAINTSTKKPHWPADLWESGTLIYNINRPEINLKPPTVRSDKVLRFESRFESGNLCSAYHIGPDTYHLVLEYDKNKSGSCQWFYFQMKNIRKDIKYTFYISGFHKTTTIDKGGVKVFYYSEIRAKLENISWSRGGYNYEYGVTQRNLKGGKRASMQFQIRFPYDNDTVYLCYALPYTYSDLQRYIMNWQKEHPLIFSSSILCKTLGGRDCPLLTITAPGSSQRDFLVFTARVHPGESNGSVVLHGLIEFLLSDHPAAKYLVENYIIKIVPMLNIDGVVEGFYRIGLSGVDLNRVWTNPDPVLHPVITATKELIRSLSQKNDNLIKVNMNSESDENQAKEETKQQLNDKRINNSFQQRNSKPSHELNQIRDNDDDNFCRSNYLKSSFTTEKNFHLIENHNNIFFHNFDNLKNKANSQLFNKTESESENFESESEKSEKIENNRNRVAVYIDFHGHSRLNGSFAYGCPNPDDLSLMNTEKLLPRMISFLSDAFSWGSCQFSFPKERKAASRIVIRKELGIIHSFTIESSFGGIITGPRSGVLYDENVWKELGSKCGEGVYHMVTKDTSPLAYYVMQELQMITPLDNNDEEEDSRNHKNNLVVIHPNHNLNEEDESDENEFIGKRKTRYGTPSLFHMENPKNFMIANPKIITDRPPGYIAPKWSQIQLTKR